MSKHDHVKECKHEVKVCADCDVAYCTNCEKEWGTPCILNHYPYTWWYTTPTVWPSDTTITYGVAGEAYGSVASDPVLAHAHN